MPTKNLSNEYLNMVEKESRSKLLSLTKQQEKEVYNVYKKAGQILANKYKAAGNNTARKALFADYLRSTNKELTRIIKDYSLKGATIPLEMQETLMDAILNSISLDVGDYKLNYIVSNLSDKAVKNIIRGNIYKDGKGLSKRIYKASVFTTNSLQETVNACLAQNMSAADMSKLLKQYVDPVKRKNWNKDKIKKYLGKDYAKWNNNLEYNALRLARTTITHSATIAIKQSNIINPYANKVQWHSVHAIGRTCAECEERDGQVYSLEDLPFDHPNGLCYMTNVFDVSLKDMAAELRRWNDGESNEMLDSWWDNLKKNGSKKIV